MIETEALIVKIENNMAFVETQRQSGCGHCNPKKECASSTLSKFFGSKPTFFKALNPVNALTGDLVVIGVADGAILKSALAIYFLPLIVILTGAGLGNFFAASDTTQDINALIGAGLGLIVSYIWIRFYTASVVSNESFQPVILRKVVDRKIIKLVKEV